eukprot:UN00726
MDKDTEGRTIYDIWSFSWNNLEKVHNYIQWLFPTDEKSRPNPSAPILNKKTISVMCKKESIQKHLYKSFILILDFRGLEIHEETQIRRSTQWFSRYKNWCEPIPFFGNHNWLRITRVLKCL